MKPIFENNVFRYKLDRTLTDKDIIVLKMNAKSTKRVRVDANFLQNGERKYAIRQHILPNYDVTVVFEVKELHAKNWFPMTRPGNLKGTTAGLKCDISKIDEVEFEISKVDTFEVYSLEISQQLPDFTVHGKPCVDKFGQYTGAEWKGKIKSEEELVKKLRDEAASYENIDYNDDEKLDRFGGFKDKKFEKKGYFYVTNDGERDYIVTPEGNGFFSMGIGYGSANRLGCYGYVDGMEEIHEWLPAKDDEKFKVCYSEPNLNPEFVKRNGREIGKDRVMFNFTIANFIRAFGDEWLDKWCLLQRGRMKKWGFNTVCIGVDEETQESQKDFAKRLNMPYIIRMVLFPRTKTTIFRDFCDVFSDEYKELSAKFAQQLAQYLDDENFMGFYMYNEPEWMAADHNINMAKVLLSSDEETVSKKVVIDMLKEKYGDIATLNEKWQQNFADFDCMTEFVGKSEEMEKVLGDISVMLVNKFFDIPAIECKKVVVDKAINFGYRSAGPWAASFGLGSDELDVYSFNCYKPNPADDIIRAGEITNNKPQIISEWHIGLATDKMFTPGLKGAKDEHDRGIACRDYMLAGASCKNCVGIHYFEYCDMSLLGRFDGACAAIGWIDVCGLPYEETMDIIAKGNAQLYDIVVNDKKLEFNDGSIGSLFW